MMNQSNCDILHTICEYCDQMHLKKICKLSKTHLITICEYCDQMHLKKICKLSKTHNRVAKYMLIHKFGKYELVFAKEYHHKIYLSCHEIPDKFYDKICILNLSYGKLTFLPESIGNLAQLQDLSVSDNRLTFLPES